MKNITSFTPSVVNCFEMWQFYVSYLIYYGGLIYRYVGAYQTAAFYFGQAYKIDPSFTRARLDQAILLWRELAQYNQALEYLTLLANQPEQEHLLPDIWLNRAMIYQAQGQFPAAMADLQQFMALAPAEHPHWHTAVQSFSHLQQLLAELEKTSGDEVGKRSDVPMNEKRV